MSRGAAKIRLAKLALTMDLYLAHETETLDTFILQTTADEYLLWMPVVGHMQDLSGKAKGADGDALRALSEAVSGYTSLLDSLTLPAARNY
jgi:hypothetical protein